MYECTDFAFQNIIVDGGHRKKIIKTYKERRENSPSQFVPVQARRKVDFLELEAMPNPRGWEQEDPQGQQTSGQGNKSNKGPQRRWEKAARKVSSTETLGKHRKHSCWQGSLSLPTHPRNRMSPSRISKNLQIHPLSEAWVSIPVNSCLRSLKSSGGETGRRCDLGMPRPLIPDTIRM